MQQFDRRIQPNTPDVTPGEGPVNVGVTSAAIMMR
jgi:hypothetical protein